MFESPGVITLIEWTMMPDGELYKYLWGENWRVVTDKETGIEGFRSSEKWQLHGGRTGSVVIPGCQVKGFARCSPPPPSRQCYCIDLDERC